MYFIRRLIFAVPLLLVISALAFWLVHLAPGGPFDRERAPASPEIERNLKATYHLDEPVWKQYLRLPGRSGPRRFWPVISNIATTASTTSSRRVCRFR